MRDVACTSVHHDRTRRATPFAIPTRSLHHWHFFRSDAPVDRHGLVPHIAEVPVRTGRTEARIPATFEAMVGRRNQLVLMSFASIFLGGCDEPSASSCEEAAGHLEDCGIAAARTGGSCSQDNAEQVLSMSCDELDTLATSNAKSDSGFGSWECLEFGICPEVASAIPAVPGAPVAPSLPIGADRSGPKASSQECKQACQSAIDFYKNVCHNDYCEARTSFSDDKDRQTYCSVTRAKFYEHAQCAMTRFDYAGFCQIAMNFVPNAEHEPPIRRALDRAQECANAYAKSCGGGLVPERVPRVQRPVPELPRRHWLVSWDPLWDRISGWIRPVLHDERRVEASSPSNARASHQGRPRDSKVERTDTRGCATRGKPLG